MRADGHPHRTPVRFDLDGDQIVFTTWHQTVQLANLCRALCVDDDTLPYRFMIIEGTAPLSADLGEIRTGAARISHRYMGEAQAAAATALTDAPGEFLIRVIPTHSSAGSEVANWQ